MRALCLALTFNLVKAWEFKKRLVRKRNINFRCFWNGEGLESEYTHISELAADDFLNVRELDQDYSYDEEYDVSAQYDTSQVPK